MQSWLFVATTLFKAIGARAFVREARKEREKRIALKKALLLNLFAFFASFADK